MLSNLEEYVDLNDIVSSINYYIRIFFEETILNQQSLSYKGYEYDEDQNFDHLVWPSSLTSSRINQEFYCVTVASAWEKNIDTLTFQKDIRANPNQWEDIITKINTNKVLTIGSQKYYVKYILTDHSVYNIKSISSIENPLMNRMRMELYQCIDPNKTVEIEISKYDCRYGNNGLGFYGYIMYTKYKDNNTFDSVANIVDDEWSNKGIPYVRHVLDKDLNILETRLSDNFEYQDYNVHELVKLLLEKGIKIDIFGNIKYNEDLMALNLKLNQ